MNAQPLVCNVGVFTPEQHARHDEAVSVIFSQVEETISLPDGYAFRLSGTLWPSVVEFVTLERMCCPFFNFGIQFTNTDSLHLSLTGPQGVKDLLVAELGVKAD